MLCVCVVDISSFPTRHHIFSFLSLFLLRPNVVAIRISFFFVCVLTFKKNKKGLVRVSIDPVSLVELVAIAVAAAIVTL